MRLTDSISSNTFTRRNYVPVWRAKHSKILRLNFIKSLIPEAKNALRRQVLTPLGK
jgi:hypothetical protein